MKTPTITLTKDQVTDLVTKLTGKAPAAFDVVLAMEKFGAPKPEITQEKFKTLTENGPTFKVVGVTFEGRQNTLKTLAEGETLTFERQPQNQYDPNAIAVKRADGTSLGYIGKELAPHLHDVIESLQGRISAMVGSAQHTLGIRFQFTPKSSTAPGSLPVIAPVDPVDMDAITPLVDSYTASDMRVGVAVMEAIMEEADTTVKRTPKKPRKPRKSKTPSADASVTTPAVVAAPAEQKNEKPDEKREPDLFDDGSEVF